jgi:hypothetical protein
VVITGLNFGPPLSYTAPQTNSNVYVTVGGKNCNAPFQVVNDSTILCETSLALTDRQTYAVVLSVGGQTATSSIQYSKYLKVRYSLYQYFVLRPARTVEFVIVISTAIAMQLLMKAHCVTQLVYN